MKKIFLIILLFIGATVSAQTNQPEQQASLDSLYKVWEDETKPDADRSYAFREFIWDGFLFNQPDTAYLLADKLLAFGREKNFPKATSYAYNTQGASFAIRADFAKALIHFKKDLRVKEQMGDLSGKSTSLQNIGRIYIDQGDYPKALDCFNQSLKIDDQLGNQKDMAGAINGVANIYYLQGDTTAALDYYNQSLIISEQIDDEYGIGNNLNNMGLVYMEHGDYAEALNYFNRSLKFAKINERGSLATTLNNIGSIYKKQGNYAIALKNFNEGLKLNEQIEDQDGIALSLGNIGTLYQVMGNYKKALDYCHKAYDLGKSIGTLEHQRKACSCLFDTYKAMGKSNKALASHELLNVINDSLNAEETAKSLQRMEFNKQVFADSMANAEQARIVKAKSTKTRNILLGSTLLFLLIAGGLFSRWRFTKKAKNIIEIEKDRSNNLLLNILPADIAEELKIHGKAEARDFDMVSILFTDFKGFTEASAKLSASDLVAEINTCFEAFDGIMAKYGIEKIKTIGDAYMAAGGLPVPTDDSIKNTVRAAIEMQDFIGKRKAELDAQNKPAFEMRVGIHTGPVVAGIVGVKKFQYDIWGDTVNTAARMESSGKVGKVNISQATYELLNLPAVAGDKANSVTGEPEFTFESRGKIAAKGKGEIDMWFVKKTQQL